MLFIFNILKTIAFPTAEQLWALESCFQNCAEGKKKTRIGLFAFALSAFAFLFALFFIRARERESAKKLPPPTSENYKGGRLTIKTITVRYLT
jgi:hypothetical protein